MRGLKISTQTALELARLLERTDISTSRGFALVRIDVDIWGDKRHRCTGATWGAAVENAHTYLDQAGNT